jgi:hypothetical protein
LKLPYAHANQLRGSWIATVEHGAAALGLPPEDPLVPVIIEDEQSKIDWKDRKYSSLASESRLSDWWNRAAHAEWRRLMEEGRPILLRRGMDWETRTAGKKVAFFRIEDLMMSTFQMTFRIVERVAECKL